MHALCPQPVEPCLLQRRLLRHTLNSRGGGLWAAAAAPPQRAAPSSPVWRASCTLHAPSLPPTHLRESVAHDDFALAGREGHIRLAGGAGGGVGRLAHTDVHALHLRWARTDQHRLRNRNEGGGTHQKPACCSRHAPGAEPHPWPQGCCSTTDPRAPSTVSQSSQPTSTLVECSRSTAQ